MTARITVRFLACCLVAARGAEEEAVEKTKPYVAPSVEGLHWAETFDGDVWTRWAHSAAEKYNGKFTVEKRTTEALTGDLGLLVPEEAKHYGIAATFPPVVGAKDTAFVVQFEAKFQDSLSCGGSYIKLYDSEGKEASAFDSDTPYVIMFGPDKCGSTNKVHFILRHKSPITGKWEEKHHKTAASVPYDSNSHLYGLVINADNKFEVLIDGEKKASGSLLTDMDPPINPAKEIDDPSDSKPTDWVDEAKIDDPASAKPDDWDEDAPSMIADPDATMPSGWLEDAEKKIADPAAKKPEDWDEEEDGDWEPPIIENPACKVGCGTWEAPKISNPKYKGKWYAPKIENPAYKGEWAAKQIDNPDYFLDETPAMLPKIDAVGIDIWTMSKGIMFDNLVISTDAAAAKAFADSSFKLRKELEELQAPPTPAGSPINKALDLAKQNPIPVIVTLVVLLLTTIWCCCCRSGVPAAPSEEEQKKRKEEKENKTRETGEKTKEDKEETKEGDEKEEKEEKKEKKGTEDNTDKKEDGLGDLSSKDD